MDKLIPPEPNDPVSHSKKQFSSQVLYVSSTCESTPLIHSLLNEGTPPASSVSPKNLLHECNYGEHKVCFQPLSDTLNSPRSPQYVSSSIAHVLRIYHL
ncbi:hypothetical protein Scep_021516 [Stephania cephalantha]|uniref:Uncharacterized protein n=1 Tax=Stephania cephalantha TaxID=152367 RepID=A0AAP0F944_9MAGN